MIEKNMTLKNTEEYEFNLATMVVSTASQFRSLVEIVMGDKTVNAKSMMGMTYLMLVDGDEVMVRCTGADEEKAMEAVAKVLGN